MGKINYLDIHPDKYKLLLKRMLLTSLAEVHSKSIAQEKSSYCPVCHNNEISHYEIKNGFELDKCEHCGHVFCNPMPTDEQLESYYNGEMKLLENQIFRDTFEKRIPIFNARVEKIKQYMEEGKLLDVGSAVGIFVESLVRNQNSLSISCCDPSKDACSSLNKRFGDNPSINIYNCWLHEMPAENKFDGITLWDTLEHITDLSPFCEKIFELLKPGGYWFFSTPNLNSLEWSIAGRDHEQLVPPGHVNLFNKNNILILLKKFGFELIEITTPNGSMDVGYVEKLAHGSSDYDLKLGTFIKAHLTDPNFKSALSDAITHANLGGNMFVIARKSI
ncbi:hypothetical protein PCIT_a1796 [Pseudoalteromonas citrea]|uniref:Class I SAM-dependent methyltransferase n=2 Tax=Pseudoalteromonas citrea TaxID=43655 RepID=A0AAD4AMR2_9GAMM|nr:class I SAM-dependent methyltransferase [Pseudoalteromonas citrea]KAF7775580.1 hypothetical protein PCIT_a1796 [Pseudoalteromonas citrea]